MIIIVPLILVVGFLAWLVRPKGKLSPARRAATLITIVPALVVALAAVIFQLLHNVNGPVSVSDISNALFVVGLGLIAAYLAAAVAAALARRFEVARGLAFGACWSILISVVDLGLLEWLGGV